MLTVPQAKVLLKNHKNDLVPVILGCQTHFKITIDGQFIAAQRSGQTPQARQFKTLSAAYSYLRTHVKYQGDVSIRLLEYTAETDGA
ncbi:MAG TPA: hypothetical protein PKC11_08005 [Agitococcus sp.]|nr:hypothetical protein [Agitococcus sp.]HMX99389.1 hypothetical protein [Agitococcus sp.]HMY28954.1 hypothetical protein [Agitococcus sp.]